MPGTFDGEYAMIYSAQKEHIQSYQSKNKILHFSLKIFKTKKNLLATLSTLKAKGIFILSLRRKGKGDDNFKIRNKRLTFQARCSQHQFQEWRKAQGPGRKSLSAMQKRKGRKMCQLNINYIWPAAADLGLGRHQKDQMPCKSEIKLMRRPAGVFRLLVFFGCLFFWRWTLMILVSFAVRESFR